MGKYLQYARVGLTVGIPILWSFGGKRHARGQCKRPRSKETQQHAQTCSNGATVCSMR